MILGPLCGAVFSCRCTPTQSFLCTYYFVYIFQHSRMVFFVVYVSKITQQSFWVPVYDAAKEGGLRSCTRGRVDILRGRLWCHLYDPRFVDDASRAVSFLYDPDDPGLVALAVFRGLDLCTESGCLLPGQTDEQASCEGKGDLVSHKALKLFVIIMCSEAGEYSVL